MKEEVVHAVGADSAAVGRVPSRPIPEKRPFYVTEALRGLTRVQRQYVLDGAIHGDPKPQTVRALRDRALFYLKIDSPNGRCGFYVLTPLGETVRRILRERQEARA